MRSSPQAKGVEPPEVVAAKGVSPPPEPDSAAVGQSGRRRRMLLASIASGTLLNPLNSSMIAVALVDVSRDFGIDFRRTSWLISAFYLASAIGQPLMGRLSDLLGRKRVFLGGLAVTAVASGLAALAPSFAALVAFRSVQAFGTSALSPAGVGLIRHSVKERQVRALGVLSIAAYLSAGIGPTLGGLLVAAGGWQAIFYANLPIVLLAGGLAMAVLPPDPPLPSRSYRRGLALIDPLGALLFAVTLFATTWFLLSLEATVAWWALAVVPLAGAGFLRQEASHPTPFIDTAALRANTVLLATYGQFALMCIVSYAVFFAIPVFLQEGQGLSPEGAGLVLFSFSGFSLVAIPFASRSIERLGTRANLIAGAAVLTGGSLAILLLIGRVSSPSAIAALLIPLGASTGAITLTLQTRMYRAAPLERIGSAAGLFNTFRSIGSILAASLLGITLGSHVDLRQLQLTILVTTVISGAILMSALIPGQAGRSTLPSTER